MSPSTSTTKPALFQPIKLGDIHLSHRVVMAPLTRYRADENHVPLPFMAEYYAQRSNIPGTLIITEATLIAPQAGGYDNVPGVWNDQQITEWKKVRIILERHRTILPTYTHTLLDYRCSAQKQILHLPPTLGSRTHC